MRLIHLLERLDRDTVTPKWAVGKNTSHARGWVKAQLTNPDYMVVWVGIQDVFAHSDSGFALDPHDPRGGTNAIDDRVNRAIQHWADGGYMNPSDIMVDEHGTVQWGDGRHRMVAAFQLGHEYAPSLIERDNLPMLEQSGIDFFVRN